MIAAMINSPIYCLTSDIDSASEFCIEEFIKLASSYGIKPTVFTACKSLAIGSALESNEIDVGIRPDPLFEAAAHADAAATLDDLFALYPDAKAFRSRNFVDSFPLLEAMAGRGVTHDSNLCLYLQPDIVPLNLAVAPIVRFPVFWQDDVHWVRTGGNWDLEKYLAAFTSPGLKIISVHAFDLAVNTPNQEFHSRVAEYKGTLGADSAGRIRFKGRGVKTFLVELLELLSSRGERFHCLSELHRMFSMEQFMVPDDETRGRTTEHSEEDYQRYLRMTDEEKQRYIRTSYQKRDAKDKYATSRDFNLRELEIRCIGRCLGERGSVLDLGCGNGYTLLSLARRLKGWDMTGVDFAHALIEGAAHLLEDSRSELQSVPRFVCADAIEYLKTVQPDSTTYVITERFVLNLPSRDAQRQVLRRIHGVLAPGGRLIMCEGARDGTVALNDLREKVGLERIPETCKDKVSALLVDDKEMEDYVQKRIGFKLVARHGLSQYFVMSRVLHPLLVAPRQPRFDAKINELARLMQEHMPFKPGYGPVTLWVFEKR